VPAPAAARHGQGAQQLPPPLGTGAGGVTTGHLADPTSYANNCPPEKIASALSVNIQAVNRASWPRQGPPPVL